MFVFVSMHAVELGAAVTIPVGIRIQPRQFLHDQYNLPVTSDTTCSLFQLHVLHISFINANTLEFYYLSDCQFTKSVLPTTSYIMTIRLFQLFPRHGHYSNFLCDGHCCL